MLTRIIAFIIAVTVFLFAGAYAQNPEICGAANQQQSQTGGAYCTSFGTVKALLIFIDFKDDISDPSNPTWPVGTGPNFLNRIVDSSETQDSGIYANVSTFFNDQSHGQFKMIGKAYYVQAPEALAIYRKDYTGSEIDYATKDAIQRLDQSVDFSDFDKWVDSYYSHRPGIDGKLDMVFVCYRNWYLKGDSASSFIAEGWWQASLPGDVYVDNGARRIVSIQSVDVLNMIQYPRFEHLIHEFGHVWGLNHQYAPGMWSLMGQKQPSVSSFMNSLERAQLGWISFIPAPDGQEVPNIPDFGSTGTAYRITIPNTNPQEYFLIENHQGVGPYDTPDLTGAKGVYILHNASGVVPGAQGNLRVVTADGRSNWSVPYWIQNPYGYGTDPKDLIPVFQRGTINRSSGNFDRDNFYVTNPNSSHSGWNPIFAWLDERTGEEKHTVRFKGDGRDRWNTTDNNLFSPWSNPAAYSYAGNSQTNISVQITAENQGMVNIKFYLSNPLDAPPSKPQSVQASFTSSNQTVVTWVANEESDVTSGGGYNIYRKFYYGTTVVSETKVNSSLITATTFADNFTVPGGIPAGVVLFLCYKVEAVDNQSKVSVRAEGNLLGILPAAVSANTSVYGQNICLGSVAVNAAITLTLLPGTSIKFANGSSLTVNGTLNAVGTSTSRITFDRSGTSGTWGGIIFNGWTSGGTIKYAHISYATYGIRFQGGGPNPVENTEIDHCSYGIHTDGSGGSDYKNFNYNNIHDNYFGFFSDNTIEDWITANNISSNGYGFYCIAAEPVLRQNTINSNSSAGLFIYDGGWAYLNNNAQNILTDNMVGVDCRQYAGASLGTSSSPGYNKLSNYDYDVWANSSCPDIYAIMNCWPWGVNVYHEGSGHIYYAPTWDCGGLGKVATSSRVGIAPNQTAAGDTVAAGHDRRGQTLMADEKCQEALAEFEFVLRNYPTTEAAKSSLHLLYRCNRKLKRVQDGLVYIANVARKYPTEELGGYALKLTVPEMLREGKYNEALAAIKSIEGKFAGTELDRLVLYEEGVIYADYLNDRAKAKEAFERLIEQYPTGVVSEIARLELGLSPEGLRKETEPKTEPTSKSLLPQAFVLEQNYPNPFNPTTEIRYQIPEVSHVGLKVYDVLGREVAVLVNEQKEAGYYQASFDASGLAGGIYFYRLSAFSAAGQAGNFVAVKRMLLVR